MDVTSALVHYDEIALKGRNRQFFERRLVRNITRTLAGLGVSGVRRLHGRLLLEFGDAEAWPEIRRRLGRVFGIAYFMPAVQAETDLEALQARVVDAVTRRAGADPGSGPPSFAVTTRRADKTFPRKSPEVNCIIGAAIQRATGWPVDLENPDLRVFVSILSRQAYVAFERHDGPGGLPVGVSGRVACLMSGGIDSPVAAYRMMKRGCVPVFIHFHSHPYTDAASQDKTVEIAEVLVARQVSTRIYMVPFAGLQQRIVVETPAPYRVILYRRFMVRVAERIAHRAGATALVTGESLGQVASQTLDNMRTIGRAVDIPILRPLLGHDKREIVELAERIGTFDISIQPHGDCCSYLLPRHPVTRSSPEELEAVEAVFDIPAVVEELAKAAVVVEINPRPARATGGEGTPD